MIELQNAADLPHHLRGGVWCIGNFDGVHEGHAQMLSTGRDLARANRVPFGIMTFDPHPLTVLRPDRAHHYLTVVSQRLELLKAFDPDVLLVIEPTREFLGMEASTFVSDVLKRQLAISHIVEGPTFTFGKAARGDVEMLRSVGPAHGFAITVVPSVEVALLDNTVVGVSSSIIRWFVDHGRVADAARCLGRPYTLRGTVIKGEQRGRTIGFPTANLATPQLKPADGVYAGLAVVNAKPHAAAISVGTNPTFNGKQTTVEAYLLDFSGDLYERSVDLEFHRWERDQFTYAGVEPLVKQLHRDIADIRSWYTSRIES